ncbi:thrombospondin type 3 repeat-containing protein [Christiangramia forsetii]|uniref:Thrombospondin type 3 repeat-containing protein n=2 Tax=Christiangramia forsetii TaxID=411153 RepID=A0M330_CHRFK|nr:thrombospondin type 3 repeat-containing protein [Christiangramia forsetii]GGG26943.1 hypothetical protein GCM10011532_07900 [Christiangramia forsetii]CAL67025.1 conserved hypothetical protein, secreted [Christiangramia forsetii KT0803]
MKIFYKLIASALFLCIFFTSCTKEESGSVVENDSEVATLAFGTFVNDLNKQMQQAKDHLSDFPECSEAVPSYVEVRLTGEGYTGPETIEIALSDTPGDYDDDGIDEYFTLESDELELPEGTYILTDFAVYDSGDNLIWVAPKDGSTLANYVDDALPIIINLSAGTKKYVDVEVLCYDKRMVNEYGYLFFELETNLALDFCFFANFCDANERHFTAAYTVNIWYGIDNTGVSLYSGVGPEPMTNDDGEYYTEPVCFALPELPDGFDEDDPYVYFEATLSDWEENYGDVDPLMISGTLSYNDIMANFDGEENVDYEHLRFGCGENGGEVGCDINDPTLDCDEDGIDNGDENEGCKNDPDPDCGNETCTTPTTWYEDSDGDGLGNPNNTLDDCEQPNGYVANNDDCDDTAPGIGEETIWYLDADGDGLGDPSVSQLACEQPTGYVDNNDDVCPDDSSNTCNNPCAQAGGDDDGDGICNDQDNCDSVSNPDQADFDNDDLGDVCDPDIDNDGVLNEADNCDNTVAGALINSSGCSICDTPLDAYLEGVSGTTTVTPTAYPLEFLNGTEVGNIIISTTTSDDIEIVIGTLAGSERSILGYSIIITQNGSGTQYTAQMMIDPNLSTDAILIEVPDSFETSEFSAQIEVILCDLDI